MGLLPGGNPGTPLPPGPSPMPLAFLIPHTVELAPQLLPAGGAPTAQAFSAIPPGTKRITYWASYTSASATGSVAYFLEWTDGTSTGFASILDAASLTPVVNNIAGVTLYEQILGAKALGVVGTTTLFYQFDAPDNATGVRLLALEAGATANQGTIATAFTGAGGAGA